MRRARWIVGLALVGVVVVGLGAPAGAVVRQGGLSASVTRVTPWVSVDGEWRAELTLTAEPPPGSTLRYTIHQPLPTKRVRQRLAAILAGDDLGPELHNVVSVPLDTVRSGTSVSLGVPIRSRSGNSDRVLVPNPGIHPVEIDLLDAAGSRWFRQVLFLNRLPAEPTPARLGVAPVLELRAPPMIAADGSVTVPPDLAAELDAATDLLSAHRSMPLSVLVDPQILHDSATSDAAALQRFVDAIGTRPLLQTPMVPVDLSTIALSEGFPTLRASMVAARQSLLREFGRGPQGEIWPFDPSIGSEALELFRPLGVSHLLLAPDQVVAAKPPLEDLAGRRVQIGSESSRLDALVTDGATAARLADDSQTPGLAVHLAMTELAGIWFQLPARATGAAVIDLTDVEPTIAEQFLDELDLTSDGVVAALSVSDAFATASAATTTLRQRTTPIVRQLAPRDAAALRPIAEELTRLRGRAHSYHSTLQDPPGLAPLDDLLFTIQHRDLSAADQLRYLANASKRMTDDLQRIEAPPPRSLTVTARRARIPLRLVNRTGRVATVLVRFAGRRLELNGGHALRLVLQPGPNAITVPVLARTSGDFSVRVEVRTADDVLEIASTTIRVRSTVVSGVGVMLGGGALLFLVAWWIVTIRRARRARRERSELPPSERATPVA